MTWDSGPQGLDGDFSVPQIELHLPKHHRFSRVRACEKGRHAASAEGCPLSAQGQSAS